MQCAGDRCDGFDVPPLPAGRAISIAIGDRTLLRPVVRVARPGLAPGPAYRRTSLAGGGGDKSGDDVRGVAYTVAARS
jgi:hypothetical protein